MSSAVATHLIAAALAQQSLTPQPTPRPEDTEVWSPEPPVVTPGPYTAKPKPPSDAIILFDGKDLSKWGHAGTGPNAGKIVDTRWPVKDGYFEVQTGSGQLVSRDKFGDIQLHVEWSSPNPPVGTSQVADSGCVGGQGSGCIAG